MLKILNKVGAVSMIAGAIAFAAMSQTASAATLHGFCWDAAGCADNGTNTPTATNPPQFGFSASPSSSGDLLLVFLIPENATQPSGGIGVTGTDAGSFTSGTATLHSGVFNSSDLTGYFGFGGHNNPIGAFGAGSVTSYDVYTLNVGNETLVNPSSAPGGPEFETTISLPDDSYIVAFLNTGTADRPDWSATANSGAILEDGPTPTPEPSSLMLLGTGALGLAGVIRRRFNR